MGGQQLSCNINLHRTNRLTAYLDGGFEFEEDRLIDEDFASLGAEVFDFVLVQLYSFARSVSAYWLSAIGALRSDEVVCNRSRGQR